MNAKRTRTRFSDILRNSDWFAFLLRGFIKQQRVPVYPVERVFFAEIRGRTTGFYDSDEQPQKGTKFTNLSDFDSIPPVFFLCLFLAISH